MLVVVTVNTTLLCFLDFRSRVGLVPAQAKFQYFIELFEYIFAGIYILEGVMKMIAQGL